MKTRLNFADVLKAARDLLGRPARRPQAAAPLTREADSPLPDPALALHAAPLATSAAHSAISAGPMATGILESRNPTDTTAASGPEPCCCPPTGLEALTPPTPAPAAESPASGLPEPFACHCGDSGPERAAPIEQRCPVPEPVSDASSAEAAHAEPAAVAHTPTSTPAPAPRIEAMAEPACLAAFGFEVPDDGLMRGMLAIGPHGPDEQPGVDEARF